MWRLHLSQVCIGYSEFSSEINSCSKQKGQAQNTTAGKLIINNNCALFILEQCINQRVTFDMLKGDLRGRNNRLNEYIWILLGSLPSCAHALANNLRSKFVNLNKKKIALYWFFNQTGSLTSLSVFFPELARCWKRCEFFFWSSLRSKRFSGVWEQRKTEERDFRCFIRAKNGARVKKPKRGVGEGNEGIACRQTPGFWKPPLARERSSRLAGIVEFYWHVSFLPLPCPSFLFLALAPVSRWQNTENPVSLTFFAP